MWGKYTEVKPHNSGIPCKNPPKFKQLIQEQTAHKSCKFRKKSCMILKFGKIYSFGGEWGPMPPNSAVIGATYDEESSKGVHL